MMSTLSRRVKSTTREQRASRRERLNTTPTSGKRSQSSTPATLFKQKRAKLSADDTASKATASTLKKVDENDAVSAAVPPSNIPSTRGVNGRRRLFSSTSASPTKAPLPENIFRQRRVSCKPSTTKASCDKRQHTNNIPARGVTPDEDTPLTLQQRVSTALALTYNTRVVGREEERKSIKQYLAKCLSENTSGSIYLCGKPGTGKTATLREVFADLQSEGLLQSPTSWVNCASIKDIYLSTYKNLQGATSHEQPTAAEAKRLLVDHLKKHKNTILVGDEIDFLVSKDNAILHTLFEWTQQRDFNVIVVGIANSLDFATFAPKLKQLGWAPRHKTFKAYTRDQITAIVQRRLADVAAQHSQGAGDNGSGSGSGSDQPQLLKPAEILHPSAIGLCAAKVARECGDIRVALQLCSAVVQTCATDKRPHLIVMNEKCSKAFGSGGDSHGKKELSTLPLMQQLMLIAIARLYIKKGKKIKVAEAEKELRIVCQKKQIACDASPCALINSLACYGYLTMMRTKVPQFVLNTEKTKAVRAACQDHLIFRSLLA